MAKRGWDVVGVDVVPAAVSCAQDRAAAEGVRARFVLADVTALSPAIVGDGFSFLLDVGCFHDLRDRLRQAMRESLESIATPGATLLLLAFRPGRRGPLPHGASREDIEQAFPAWRVTDVVAAETAGMPGPLKKVAPRWYRLQRS